MHKYQVCYQHEPGTYQLSTQYMWYLKIQSSVADWFLCMNQRVNCVEHIERLIMLFFLDCHFHEFDFQTPNLTFQIVHKLNFVCHKSALHSFS